jgi:hypothetical protein
VVFPYAVPAILKLADPELAPTVPVKEPPKSQLMVTLSSVPRAASNGLIVAVARALAKNTSWVVTLSVNAVYVVGKLAVVVTVS